MALGLQLQDSLVSTEISMSQQPLVQFHPAFWCNALVNVSENNPAVALCDNPQLRSVQMVPVGAKMLPRAVKLFEESVKPSTEPSLTKVQPLNLQWSNLSTGSDKLSKSGQEWLLQQQNKCEDQVHSINQTVSVAKKTFRCV